MTLADKPISSIEKITLWILKRKKHFFFPVSFSSSGGIVACWLHACRETSCSGELWALTSACRGPWRKYVTAPLGQFCLAERERRAFTEDVENLLGTYVCMFVCWHFRKIAQELLGHVAHIVATLQLLFLLLRYNISKHLKRTVWQ